MVLLMIANLVLHPYPGPYSGRCSCLLELGRLPPASQTITTCRIHAGQRYSTTTNDTRYSDVNTQPWQKVTGATFPNAFQNVFKPLHFLCLTLFVNSSLGSSFRTQTNLHSSKLRQSNTVRKTVSILHLAEQATWDSQLLPNLRAIAASVVTLLSSSTSGYWFW